MSFGYFDQTSAAAAEVSAVAWLVPSAANAACPMRLNDAMFTPGADIVRYGWRDEKSATAPRPSTAPTETTPMHTPGSSASAPARRVSRGSKEDGATRQGVEDRVLLVGRARLGVAALLP